MYAHWLFLATLDCEISVSIHARILYGLGLFVRVCDWPISLFHPVDPRGITSREVYHDFQPGYDIFHRSGATGCSDHTFCAPQPAYTAQFIALHQHSTGRLIKSSLADLESYQQRSDNTWTRASHPITNQAQCCLTSEIIRELIFPSWWAKTNCFSYMLDQSETRLRSIHTRTYPAPAWCRILPSGRWSGGRQGSCRTWCCRCYRWSTANNQTAA